MIMKPCPQNNFIEFAGNISTFLMVVLLADEEELLEHSGGYTFFL